MFSRDRVGWRGCSEDNVWGWKVQLVRWTFDFLSCLRRNIFILEPSPSELSGEMVSSPPGVYRLGILIPLSPPPLSLFSVDFLCLLSFDGFFFFSPLSFFDKNENVFDIFLPLPCFTSALISSAFSAMVTMGGSLDGVGVVLGTITIPFFLAELSSDSFLCRGVLSIVSWLLSRVASLGNITTVMSCLLKSSKSLRYMTLDFFPPPPRVRRGVRES